MIICHINSNICIINLPYFYNIMFYFYEINATFFEKAIISSTLSPLLPSAFPFLPWPLPLSTVPPPVLLLHFSLPHLYVLFLLISPSLFFVPFQYFPSLSPFTLPNSWPSLTCLLPALGVAEQWACVPTPRGRQENRRQRWQQLIIPSQLPPPSEDEDIRKLWVRKLWFCSKRKKSCDKYCDTATLNVMHTFDQFVILLTIFIYFIFFPIVD